MVFADILTAFVLGLLTPLGAVCVLPLYPGFLAYLANQIKNPSKKTFIYLGVIIVIGVILFMLLLGLLFTTILKVSLTNVIGIISPIAFAILIIIGLLLVFNIDIGRIFPKIKTPISKKPLKGAFGYGFFFGAIVIPCNPGFIAALFAQNLLIANPITNFLSFIFFGLGIGFPLLVLSIVSSQWSSQIIQFLTKYKRIINLIAGLIMIVLAVYFLLFDFRIFG
jgi:cytochrome c-type biogenesis protein